MTKFTFTATAPNGETRTRVSSSLYTHATVRGGRVVAFHGSNDIANRAAAKASGTTVVEVKGCAKAEAFLADRRAARAAEVLSHRNLSLGDRVTGILVIDGKRQPAFVGELVTVIQPRYGLAQAVIRTDDDVETPVSLPYVNPA